MTSMMVSEEVTWLTVVDCISFKVSSGDAGVYPLLNSLSFLVEEDFRVASQDTIGVIPLIQSYCYSFLLGNLRRFLDFFWRSYFRNHNCLGK